MMTRIMEIKVEAIINKIKNNDYIHCSVTDRLYPAEQIFCGNFACGKVVSVYPYFEMLEFLGIYS
jgi:hypothetical protein